MQFRYPNLVKLGTIELTDESRGPLSEEREERSNVVELASGRKVKFIKQINRRFSLSWDNVPEDASKTIDSKGARDEIRTLAQSETIMDFVIQDGLHPVETYSVFIEEYNEEIIIRRPNLFRYKITLALEERG